MSRSRSPLVLMLSMALLVACSEPVPPLGPADGAARRSHGASSQGLVRMDFPEDFPGIPAYARIEPVPPHVYLVDGWAAIAFYRDPQCVRPDFNLLQFADVPAAFDCALMVEGFALFEPDVFPGAPKIAEAQGAGGVPFWFVPAEAALTAVQDGELTIGELQGLEGLLVGRADQFHETAHPEPDPVLGGGNAHSKLIQTTRGRLADGRRFVYQVTLVGGEVRSHRLEFR